MRIITALIVQERSAMKAIIIKLYVLGSTNPALLDANSEILEK